MDVDFTPLPANMRNFLIVLSFLVCVQAFAQESFFIKDASPYFDVKIVADHCEGSYSPTCADKTIFYFALFDIRFVPAGCSGSSVFSGHCTGNIVYSFYKKDGTQPYQVIRVSADENRQDYSCVYLDDKRRPFFNKFGYIDDQGAINIGDYNFDGMEDVAICRGSGQYGMPSYNVYLASRGAGKFVYNKDFSQKLGYGLGMFEMDQTKKVLRTIGKSGCCWHIIEEFAVVHNRPKKILEIIEDATIDDTTKMKVTTKTLVNGKWQIKTKLVPRTE